MIDTKSILELIEINKKQIIFPDKPGIYIMYAKKEINFGFIKIKEGNLMYIGKSESSLLNRKTKQHFNSEKTGSSTVRRTLGAILKDKFNIKCYLRGKGSSKNDSNCYIFDTTSENEITNWMNEHISMSFYETDNPEEIETLLINKYNPTLNLMDAKHEFVYHIKELRNICKLEAIKNGVLK